MTWSTPQDITAKVERLWNRGSFLSAYLQNTPLFPLKLRLTRPDNRDLGEKFDTVRRWIHQLKESERSQKGYGYQIDWKEINHRQLGKNNIPYSVTIPMEGDALKLIGKVREAKRLREQIEQTVKRFPNLKTWLEQKPRQFMAHVPIWESLLKTLQWFTDHPEPGLYMRQLDIPGVDTKFIEGHKGILSELLDEVLPAEAVFSSFRGSRFFETRYGLLSKPHLIRFRILDPDYYIRGLTDMTVSVSELASLSGAGMPQRVFITENNINGLSFPSLPNAMVIFGLGYSLDSLSQVFWLKGKQIYYWGDIDTHGFVMLNKLRGLFPQVHSFLMDRNTFLEHRKLWGIEPSPHRAHLSRLNPEENSLYGDLAENRLGARLRLEQEHIAFGKVVETVERL